MSDRSTRRRRLGLGLLAFGASGLALVLAAAFLVLASFSAIEDAATGFERQRAEIVGLLGPASAAMADAASSASNAGASLSETGAAAERGAKLTARLADSFDGLAGLGTLEILGARPFASTAAQFTAVSAEARALSADLTTTASSIQTNVADSQAVAADMRALADRLDRLRVSVGDATTTPGTRESSTPPAFGLARLVLIGLLAWLAVPAIGSLWLGWRFTRVSWA